MNQLILDLKAVMLYLKGYYIYRYFTTKIALFEADTIANQSALVSFQNDLNYFFAHTLQEATFKTQILDLCDQLVEGSSVGIIDGIVSDGVDPIEGVLVSVTGGGSDTTDVNGAYTIANVIIGTKTVTATKTGYDNYSNNAVVVTTGATTTLNITLTATP